MTALALQQDLSALSTALYIPKEKEPTLEVLPLKQVLRVVYNMFKITKPELEGSSRKKEIVHARWFVWGYYKSKTTYSLQHLSDMFGKNHSTALHGLREHSYLLSPKFPDDYSAKYQKTYEKFILNLYNYRD